MPDDAMEANGGEASDAVSDNEHDYDEDDYQHKDDDDKMADTQASDPAGENQGEVKKKYDPKDPLRPRRKKARRACYACQRAHLTCGKFLSMSSLDNTETVCGVLDRRIQPRGFYLLTRFRLLFTPSHLAIGILLFCQHVA